MKGKLSGFTFNKNGSQNITVTVDEDFSGRYDELKDEILDIEIKKHRNRRSSEANAFCWAMCADIGNALHPPVPKEEIYRKAIRDVGEFFTMKIAEEAVEAFKASWATRGVGWFAEVQDFAEEPGYMIVLAYNGSSTYDTKQMSRLLEYLLEDARQMGLAIPLSAKEEAEMLQNWRSR